MSVLPPIRDSGGLVINLQQCPEIAFCKTDPKTVQTLLRDSDVRLTLQFYPHAISDDHMSAAWAMLACDSQPRGVQSGLRADRTIN